MDELTRKLYETFLLFRKLHMSLLLPENLSKNEYFTLRCIEYLNKLENADGADRHASISALAKIMHVTTPAVSRTVSTLEEKGIILRRSDKNDRRNTYVELTTQGKTLLQKAQAEMNNFFNQMVQDMDPKDLEQLIQYLTEIYENACAELERKKQERKQ